MKCERIDCFAWRERGCDALKRECVKPECGFYKNIAEWYAENEISMKRLKNRDKEGLIVKYSFTLKDMGLLK